MEVLRRRPGWYGPEGRLESEHKRSRSWVNIPYSPQVPSSLVEPFYSYSTSLNTEPNWTSNYWWYHPAKLKFAERSIDCTQQSTFGAHLFWRSSRQTVSHWAVWLWNEGESCFPNFWVHLRPPIMGNCFDLSSQVQVALPCWALFQVGKRVLLRPGTFGGYLPQRPLFRS